MTLSDDAIRQAFNAVALREGRVTYTSTPPETLGHALNEVASNLDEFRGIALSKLGSFPLLNRYLGGLVRSRIKQDYPLSSDVVASLFDSQHPVEERLGRIQHQVRNLAKIPSGINAPRGKDKGPETDEVILDIWAELFVADRLLNDEKLSFAWLEKVATTKKQASRAVDFVGEHDGTLYAIEVTRVRKRDFTGDTLPNMQPHEIAPENLQDMDSFLRRKLREKDAQIAAFNQGLADRYRGLVVIKTSQWEYQDAYKVLYNRAANLLFRETYQAIEELILMYDTENFDRIVRQAG